MACRECPDSDFRWTLKMKPCPECEGNKEIVLTKRVNGRLVKANLNILPGPTCNGTGEVPESEREDDR